VQIDGHHGLSCRRSAARQSCHHAANDIIVRTFFRIGVLSIFEPPGLLGVTEPNVATQILWINGRNTWRLGPEAEKLLEEIGRRMAVATQERCSIFFLIQRIDICCYSKRQHSFHFGHIPGYVFTIEYVLQMEHQTGVPSWRWGVREIRVLNRSIVWENNIERVEHTQGR